MLLSACRLALLDDLGLGSALDVHDAALGAGDGAADSDHVQFGIDLDNVEVLHSDLVNAHVAGLMLARHDAGRIGARAHGARVTVDRAAAVGGGGAALAVTLDRAGIALALADAGDVDLLALGEDVGLHGVAHFQLAAVFQAEFFEVLEVGNAGLLQVALLGLGELALGDFLKAELDGFIAFLFLGHLLDDHTGAGLDDGDGDDTASLVEDLRHADLLANNGFFHVFSSFGYWLPRMARGQRLAT